MIDILKRIVCALSTLIMIIGVALMVCMNENMAQTNAPRKSYVNPTGDEFPIGAWYTFPKDSLPTDREFELVRESGINIGHQLVNDTSLMVRVLEKADAYGLKMSFLSEAILNTRLLPSTLRRMKKYPSFWGCYLKDEPKVSDFQFISERVNIIRDIDPKADYFVNLLAAWVPERVGASSFQEYVEDYIRVCHPRFLSVDIYPVLKDGDSFRITGRYYQTYSELLRIGNNFGLPFCAVGLTTAIPSHQWPAENNLRFEAFNALAYGAQGIIWWSYSPLPHYNPEFLGFPVNASGERSSIWYAMKTVNAEIQALKNIFLGCDVVKVGHVGTLQAGAERFGSLPAPFSSISYSSSGVLLSHLRNHDSDYLVIVNHEVNDAQRIILQRESDVERVYPDGSVRTDKHTMVNLPGGGYVIYKL